VCAPTEPPMLRPEYQQNCTCSERGRPDFRHADSCPVSPWYVCNCEALVVKRSTEKTLVNMRAPHGDIMAKEICTFRYDYDPATLAPRGRACKSAGVMWIYWKDGRTSVACDVHGIDALTDDAKREVLRVRPFPRKRNSR
jgi:hypothetical protein